MPQHENLLLIFTRNPALGKVKKRLAATIGDGSALAIYQFLLKHTAEITKTVRADKHVYFTEQVPEKDIWDQDTFQKKLQEGQDLGEKMKNAFKAGFEAGYRHIIIIGSDLYHLSTTDLDKAFDELKQADYVIGPAKDGGYYLLGMNSLNSQVFAHKTWSTNTVFRETLEDLKTKKITILDERNDIDHFEDIKDNPVFGQFLK